MTKPANAPDSGLQTEDFLSSVFSNPINGLLMQRLSRLALPDGHLCAGCLFQAHWNRRSGRPADWGIKDYDVFYFDDQDLSWEAEDSVIQQAQALVADLGVTVELRNQARVHLWYPQRFHQPYPRLRNARDGIDRYLIRCTCVGIEIHSGTLYAPDGLAELHAGRLRMNPLLPNPELFRRKALSYQIRWPWLQILDEGEGLPAMALKSDPPAAVGSLSATPRGRA